MCREAINPHLPSFCFQRLVRGTGPGESRGFKASATFWNRRTVPGLKAAKVMRLFPVLWPFSQDGQPAQDAEKEDRSGSALS